MLNFILQLFFKNLSIFSLLIFISLFFPINPAFADEPSWEFNISSTNEHLKFKDSFVEVNNKINGKTLSLVYSQSSIFAFNVYYRPEESFSSQYLNRCVPAQMIVCPAYYSTLGDFKFSSYGINWQPGYSINKDILLFAKLGIARSKYKTLIPNENTGETNAFYGFGISYNVYKNISLTSTYEKEKKSSFTNFGISFKF